MNTFKRKALSCAILGGLGAVAGTAQAVYQNPNGLGQALIFPYYTVQSVGGNAYNTYMSIVNTTSQGKAVKVRFREGKNSREVLDFNLYLSPNDVWTAALVPADATTTSPARLLSSDTSCTFPQIPAAGVDFRNFQYTGALADAAGTGLERTREGYAEVIEMSTVTGTLLTAITHVNDVPANCAAVRVNPLGTANMAAPTGGLAGSYTLINVANGADMGGDATALANLFAGVQFTDVGNEATNLTVADPVSVVVAQQPAGTTVYTNTFAVGRGVDAVSSTMMHSSVINEYVLDNATRSNTDWVMTFPTKRYYITSTSATAPFTNFFSSAGACELISFQFFNREEAGQTAAAGDFSPTQGATPDSLCWESTVMSLRNPGSTFNPTGTTSGVLGSTNTTPINVRSGFQNGWARLTFTGTNAVGTGLVAATTASRNANTGGVSAVPAVFRGLPVIGFMARTLFNGTLSCTNAGGTAASCQGSYGSLFDHRYEQNITPIVP
jgi:hypothetical protein